MHARYTALALVVMISAGCSTEPTQIRPQPSAQHQQSYSEYYQTPDPSPSGETVTFADQSVWTPVDENPISSQAVDSSASGDLMSMANQAKDAGDNASYLAYLNSAAAQGNADAHYELAKLYTDGSLIPRDMNAATAHLRSSAGFGNSEALRVMAWQLIRGDNGPKDLGSGAAMMEEAALSSVRAQRELGMLYANLYSFHLNDRAKGVQYLTTAYNNGDAEAAFQLGKLLHADGQDLDAVPALSFAVDHGIDKARQSLAQIDGSSLAVAQASYSGDQVVKAGMDPEALYQRANAIMLSSKRSLEQEAHAYALFSVAQDEGHQLAGLEVKAISGVKILMDKKDPGWLSREKTAILASHH